MGPQSVSEVGTRSEVCGDLNAIGGHSDHQMGFRDIRCLPENGSKKAQSEVGIRMTWDTPSSGCGDQGGERAFPTWYEG